MKIIAIGSGKGGVGKSTIAANLAMALSRAGHKVGIIDADVYGPTQPTLFGCQQQAATGDNKIMPLISLGVKFISVASLVDTAKPLVLRAPIVIKIINDLLNKVSWGRLDYLLIDLPPGTGDIQLSIAQTAKLTGAIIVTTPQEVAVNIAQRGLKMFELVKVPIIGIVENMALFRCPDCCATHEIFSSTVESMDELTQFKLPILSRIPLYRQISQAADDGTGLGGLTRDVAEIFEQLAANVVEQVTLLQHGWQRWFEFALLNDNQQLQWQERPGQLRLANAYELRVACPCAECKNDNLQQIVTDIHILKAVTVGNYGVKITFSDGHDTGIYSIDDLKASSV